MKQTDPKKTIGGERSNSEWWIAVAAWLGFAAGLFVGLTLMAGALALMVLA